MSGQSTVWSVFTDKIPALADRCLSPEPDLASFAEYLKQEEQFFIKHGNFLAHGASL